MATAGGSSRSLRAKGSPPASRNLVGSETGQARIPQRPRSRPPRRRCEERPAPARRALRQAVDSALGAGRPLRVRRVRPAPQHGSGRLGRRRVRPDLDDRGVGTRLPGRQASADRGREGDRRGLQPGDLAADGAVPPRRARRGADLGPAPDRTRRRHADRAGARVARARSPPRAAAQAPPPHRRGRARPGRWHRPGPRRGEPARAGAADRHHRSTSARGRFEPLDGAVPRRARRALRGCELDSGSSGSTGAASASSR